MGARVAVAGASGYAGGELLRLLAGHPDLELAAVTADSKAGQPIGIVHPQLAGLPALAGRPFDATDPGLISGCDLVFLALPAGQSAPLASQLPEATRIVDLGADFRLADPAAWARYYGGPHPGRWVCGLPELPGARARIRAATRVAAPGCYATAAIIALAPLLAAGLAEPDDVVIVAASGTSGAGPAAKPELLGSEVMGSVSAYQVAGAHRHTPEIEQALGEAIADAAGRRQPGAAGDDLLHAAAGADAARHPGHLHRPAGARVAGLGGRAARPTARLRDALAAAYASEPFVCLLPEGSWPATAAVGGSNAVHLQAAADAHAGRAVAVAAIDNLGKGAAGQAIQNANLMLGLPETAGLTTYGVAP